MKKIITLAAVMVLTICGCKTIPTVEQATITSEMIGRTSGLIVNNTKISDADKNIIVDIFNEVQMVVPQTNQTFHQAWIPIVQRTVKKLINEKKIDPKSEDIIIGAMSVACDGLDYIVTVRFPKIGEYKELVNGCIQGFVKGFTDVVTPSNKSMGKTRVYDRVYMEYCTGKVE